MAMLEDLRPSILIQPEPVAMHVVTAIRQSRRVPKKHKAPTESAEQTRSRKANGPKKPVNTTENLLAALSPQMAEALLAALTGGKK